MQDSIVSIQQTTIPDRWKKALLLIDTYIRSNAPETFTGAYLFGSLSRSDIHYSSDVDICMTFRDGTNLRERQLVIFKGMVRSISEDVPVDVVCCEDSTLRLSEKPLFKEIRKDGRRFI